MLRLTSINAGSLLVALVMAASPVFGQITTGTITGTVRDEQGGLIPSATVVLISEARGTKSAPALTDGTGNYVFPNVTADTYTVEVTLDGFKVVRRTGIQVSGGDRVGVPTITLQAGGIAETVNVTAEAVLVQSQSAERSFLVETAQIENLPITRGNFINVVAFTPGVITGNTTGGFGGAGATRLGGAGQNNIMMDGVGIMDTGNNGQMLQLNTESVGEVKILTQGYQAEFGRSSGLQITAVTKSGSNQFRGSLYDVERNSKWNSNSWVNMKNGDPKPVTKEKDWGYSIGGPVGRPGGTNKLFFFYSHEYRPRNNPINNGNPIRRRVPTALERVGDFSQSLDNNGAPIPQLRDPITRQPFPGNRIPQDRLYSTGLAILNRYPLPNIQQAAATDYNYQVAPPKVENLIQQPVVRLDYQISPQLRLNWVYSGQRGRRITTPGQFEGFTDVITPYPYITHYATNVNYMINSTTFLEGTWGFTRNELTGGNEGGVLVNESANRLKDLAAFPLLYPNAGQVSNDNYYALEVLNDVTPPWWDAQNRMINLPPLFAWGNRIQGNGGTCAAPGPPCQRYPGWLNINRTNDVGLSVTKVMGRHTLKAGFYNNHSFKAQNTGAGGIANLTFQGYVNFANDTNNALDTGFGFANAATGVFTQYLQASQFIEGHMVYDNTEFYVQDNWKVNNRLTMDYGVRFTRQQPQHDRYQQMSNFFPEQWSASQAPFLYIAGCSNGARTCSGNTRNAMDPRTGQILTAPGAANTQAAIGTPIPNSGNLLNGIQRAGEGIAKTGYTWPTLVIGPRFGMAYDLMDDQSTVLRAGGGLYYDRPDGNTVFSIPGNPPLATARDLRNGQLQTLGQGLSPVPVPALITFQYDAKVPASWQWQTGVQRVLPWYTTVDVSYVGNHGFNRLGQFQGGARVNLNAVDIGAAYLPQNQDPTLTSTVPGAAAYTTNLLRPYRGLGTVEQNTTEFYDTYHSMQFSLTRRFRNGFSFGANYTLGLSFTGNTGLGKRLQHNADGTFSLRADQAEYEELNKNLDMRPHFFKANAIWAPRVPEGLGRIAGLILNDWQIAGVLTAGSGQAYDLTYTYQNNGSNVNLTGSPDYGARILFTGDPGSGCSDNQYLQFSTAAVTGPTYGSVGLESGRNVMRACPNKIVDLSLSRDIRIGASRALELRLDIFNAFNTVVISDRQEQIQFVSPTNLTVRNSQTLADGSIDPARLTPRTAGFGAAQNAMAMRTMQMQIRFRF